MDKTIKFEFVKRYLESPYFGAEGKTTRLPERSTKHAAGYDFYNPETVRINPGEIVYVKTGVKAKFPEEVALLLLNRSSNPKKKGLELANGVGLVDADYYDNPDNEGEIAFAFKNTRDYIVTIEEGEKLGQGMFVPFFITVDDGAEIKAMDRKGGFGSSDE